MRVNMNVPDELIKRLDAYAKSHYMTRSSVMCQACDEYLTAKEVVNFMSQLLDVMKEVASKNEIDEDSKKQLEEMEMFVKSIQPKKY